MARRASELRHKGRTGSGGSRKRARTERGLKPAKRDRRRSRGSACRSLPNGEEHGCRCRPERSSAPASPIPTGCGRSSSAQAAARTSSSSATPRATSSARTPTPKPALTTPSVCCDSVSTRPVTTGSSYRPGRLTPPSRPPAPSSTPAPTPAGRELRFPGHRNDHDDNRDHRRHPTDTTPGPRPTAPTTVTPASRSGYWMVGSDGHVYPFGAARALGDAAPAAGAERVDIEPDPERRRVLGRRLQRPGDRARRRAHPWRPGAGPTGCRRRDHQCLRHTERKRLLALHEPRAPLSLR